MTNITDIDRDAVDWLYEMGAIAPHHLTLANEAFARHREKGREEGAAEERAKIVTWLRDDADQVVNADSPVSCADVIAEAIVECAVAIEAKEHLK